MPRIVSAPCRDGRGAIVDARRQRQAARSLSTGVRFPVGAPPLCVPLRLREGLWPFQCKELFVERLRNLELAPDSRTRLADHAPQATAIACERYVLYGQVRQAMIDYPYGAV